MLNAFVPGASALQSPLIMPMLMLPSVPIHFAGHQTAYLLHQSEYFFPPLNLLCTLGNTLLTGIAFYYSRSASSGATAAVRQLAAAKAPKLMLAAALNIATTAWALVIQVPMNKRMTVLAGEMGKGVERGEEKEPRQRQNELEFRGLQSRWRKLNYGRAAIMISSAIASGSALLAHA